MSNLSGVVCCWQYNPKKKTPNKWTMDSAIPVDDTMCRLDKPKLEKFDWKTWCYVDHDDGYSYSSDPIMGTAVTFWNYLGVQLFCIHPHEWIDFLSPNFYEEVTKIPNWHSFIEGGYLMMLKTVEEAQKLVVKYAKKA